MRLALSAVSVLALAATLATAAHADGRIRAVDNALYAKECGACHMAFPPQFLPSGSWREIMAGLSNHFGEDASLAPNVQKEIADYLRASSRGDWKDSGAPIRITDLSWFRHEHGEDEARVMKIRKGVKTWANCQACHGGGRFDDDD